jgi:predicted porin
MKIVRSLVIFLVTTLVTVSDSYSQSSVTLYGILDEGINYVNNVQTVDASGKRVGRSQLSTSSSIMAGSRLGLRGIEDLGRGYKAIFQIESGFDVGTGNLQQGGTFFGRQAIVGISGTYGSLTVGHQYDFVVDFVQPTSAIVKNIGPTFASHGDEIDNLADTYRVNNSIKFTSADYNGLKFGGLYSFGGVAGSMSRNDVFSLGASYVHGPVKAGIAFVSAHEPNLSYWGDTQNGSSTGNNLGATSGVQSNPVYGGFASARTLNIFAAGIAYALHQVVIGINYSNIRFENLNDPNAGTLSETNPFGYHGTAIFSDYSAFATYNITPSASLIGAYNLLVGGAIDGKAPAKYNQFNAALNYFLSKHTEVYLLAEYQLASGTDSTKQAAVPLTETITPSNSARQVIFRLGMLHSF